MTIPTNLGTITQRFLCGTEKIEDAAGGALSNTSSPKVAAPFDKKMNVTGKRMEDSIRMLDAGALFTQNNKRDPNMPAVPATAKSKLNMPLETREKLKSSMSSAQKGFNEATSEDIHEILSEALTSSKFRNLFRGTRDASRVVDFNKVTVNSDVSHVYAEWQCDVLEGFTRELHEEMGSDYAVKFAERGLRYITQRLASKESVFRTILMRQMHFKKVPRIYFKHDRVRILDIARGETGRKAEAEAMIESLRRGELTSIE